MKIIKAGCSGFPVSHRRYYDQLPIIEIDQSFIRLPQLKTAQRWRAEAPSNFEFIVTVWQGITHPYHAAGFRHLKPTIPESKKMLYGAFAPTKEVFDAWNSVYQFGQALRSKVYLFNMWAGFHPTVTNITNLYGFFKKIQRKGIMCVWQPPKSWDHKLIETVHRDCGLNPCSNPHFDTPRIGTFRYYRLRPPADGKPASSSLTSLDIAAQSKRIIEAADTPLTYIILDTGATMFADALKVSKSISSRSNML